MAAWQDVATTAPEFAGVVRSVFAVRKHATMASIALDGSPRISGTEVAFDADGNLYLGMMAGALRASDLRRDPRVAVHSPTVDPPDEKPTDWAGDAKIVAHAVEVGETTADAESHRFRLDIDRVVLTKVSADELALDITVWTSDGTLRTLRRT